MLNIRTIIKPRQGGKTTTLIRMSAETGYPIITYDVPTGKLIKKQAKEMGLQIPDPISIVNILRGNVRSIDAEKVLIDDADMILNRVMNMTIKSEVEALSLVKRNAKGQEVTATGKAVQ